MKHAWEIMGSAIEEAWDHFLPLTKIWLTTVLLVGIIQIVAMSPTYMDMYNDIMLYDVYNLTSRDGLIYLAITILGYFITCGLLVNSWRFLVNDSYKPSWVPLRLDWKVTTKVFGYLVLLALIFVIFSAIAVVIWRYSAMGLARGFFVLDINGTLTIGQRFFMALSYFGMLIGLFVLIYGAVYCFRGSMIMVERSLKGKEKFTQILRGTRKKGKLFTALMFVYLFFTFIYIIVIYLATGLVVTTSIAVLFFLPPQFAVIIGCALAVIFLVFATITLNYFTATMMAELYRRILVK